MPYVVVLILAWLACTVASAAPVPITFHVTVPVTSPSIPDYRSHLIHWEGLRYGPYRDPSGEGLCMGVGHQVRNGTLKAAYTAAQVEALYAADLRRALRSARAGVAGFDELPPEARLVCVGLAWTTGTTGFYRFHRFRAALSRRDYTAAARELRHSRWFSQEHERATVYVTTLQHLARY